MGALCSQAPSPVLEDVTEQGVKVFALPMSQNAMGPVLLAMDAGRGQMEMCDIMKGDQMKPEFLAMNPFHHIPTMKDGDFSIGESSAILRYLANQYKPQYYPREEPTACGWIDFAMDSFNSEVYSKHKKVVYPVMGFAAAPADKAAANKEYTEAIATWATHFLKGKFVLGDEISIADFKAVPFLFAAIQPSVAKVSEGFQVPDRARVYVEDFCKAVPATSMLSSAGGFSILEYCASKAPDAPKLPALKPAADGKFAVAKAGGTVKVFGMPPSQNVVGSVMLAMEAKVGGMEHCDIMNGAQMKPEFLAMNPYHHIPTMQDGDFAIGEGNSILRYLAMKYKPEYYPLADVAMCGTIDFAMDSFSSEVYPKSMDVVYIVMGFKEASGDQAVANKAFGDVLDTWASHFLKKGKFVCGDKITIADFKVAPFLFAAMQPGIETKTGFKASERVRKYVEDFVAAVPSASFMKDAGGYSIAEWIASKAA